MRCSLSFVLAALAATGSTTAMTNRVSRDSGHERFVRRSPDEKHIDAKEQIKAKCYGIQSICDSMVQTQSSSQFSSFQSISNVATFQQNQGVLPFPGQDCFAEMTNWQSASGGIASFANVISAYGAFVSQQQIQISTFISSFSNLCQIIAVFVTRFQSLGQIGGGGGVQLMTNYFQLIVTMQGFVGYAAQTFGFQAFCQMAGSVWTQFVSQMTIIFQIGQTCGFFQDPGFCIGQGFNMGLWRDQFQFSSISQMFAVNQFSSTSANFGTFSIGNRGGFGGGGSAFGNVQVFNQQQFYQRTQISSSQSQFSGGGSYIGGGGHGGPDCYPNCQGGGGGEHYFGGGGHGDHGGHGCYPDCDEVPIDGHGSLGNPLDLGKTVDGLDAEKTVGDLGVSKLGGGKGGGPLGVAKGLLG